MGHPELQRQQQRQLQLQMFLDLGHAAVDEEFYAGDEAAVVGGQEDDGFGDFAGVADAAQGDAGDHAGLEGLELIRVGEEIIGAWGFDGAGADDVDANFPVFEVGGPSTREGADGGFGGAIDGERRDTFGAGDGAINYDGAAIAQERQGLLDGEEDAFYVDAEFFVELGFGDGGEGSEAAASGVGENNVEMAFLFFDGGEDAVEVGELGDVALDGGDVFADLFYGGVEFGLAASGDEDVGAFGDEFFGGGEADAAIAAGDECDFSF